MSEYINFTNFIDTNDDIKALVKSFGDNKYEILLNTLYWMKLNMSKWVFDDNTERMKHFRNRKASDIFNSKKSTGCTDMGILFCTFIRTAKISCSYIETVSQETLDDIKNMEKADSISFRGHVFCRVNFDEKEFLVDPTTQQIFLRKKLPQENNSDDIIFAEGNDYEELGLKDIDSQIEFIIKSDLIK